jgi:hypothetical protein
MGGPPGGANRTEKSLLIVNSIKNCLVFGSGRSGTSMLSGCLYHAGYFMGEKLYEPSPENPRGYFESRSVESINEQILKQTLYGPRAPILNRLFARRLERGHYWLADIPLNREVVIPAGIDVGIDKITSNRPYAFKDPRFSYTLPVWRPLISNVAFIVVFREPDRTVSSIIKNCRNSAYLRNFKISVSKAYRIWICIYLHVLKNFELGGDWAFVHYDQILEGSGLDRVSEILSIQLKTDFPDPSLKRAVGMTKVPEAAGEIYKELCRLAQHRGALY